MMNDRARPEGQVRAERDSMGEVAVPADALYGAQTARAVENFRLGGRRLPRPFIRALGLIKLAAAETNYELGLLSRELAEPIARAAREVADGEHDRYFVVEVYQTGSGTSTNMNANEVIGNRANQLLGGELGARSPIHPNDHVNLSQSSNDVIPTALHLSLLETLDVDLEPALRELVDALEEKARQFWPIIKTGRTHLQDATPIRLGQEFRGYAGQIEAALRRLGHARGELTEVALGGTAVGTGVNTHPGFARLACARLSALLGWEVRESPNHFAAQSNLDAAAFASGALRGVALALGKIADDVRWLGSGPRAGLGELRLPEAQPGSSIMPGKVNPVIPESVLMVCARVHGLDASVVAAARLGNFELNTGMPLAAADLLEAAGLLAAAARNLTARCIRGLQATERGPELVERGLAISTALAPVIGYDRAAAISKEAHETGRTVREVARERTVLSDGELDRVLDPERMTEPGTPLGGGGA